MMEDPLSRGASPSGDSGHSGGGGEIGATTIVTPLDDRLLDVSARHSLSMMRTPPARKAKRIRFFRNGDKFYTGVVMAVTPERYRSFDSLATDLTRALISCVTLPNGVRAIYTMDGRKVQSVNDLEDGKCYVCSGQGETFKKVEYSSSKVRRGSSLSGLPQSPAGPGSGPGGGRSIGSAVPTCVRARIVTLIRNGTKPRRVLRLLLSKRNAPSLEHALEAITEAVKLDSGAVRRVYSISGHQILTLEQFFDTEEVFLAYGTDKFNQEDFELDFEESKAVQSFRRGPWVSKRQGGPMPRMPRKSGKKPVSTPQVRTPSPASLLLPQPLRMHYAVGHVIGDGNFAVVRHCVHKTSGTEYAMKIVDKYKCQGKETMLASEVAILRQVCHPNIISLIAEQETTDQLFLVMELVKGGDLFDAIAAATKFSEPEASVMIGHLTSALAYLHSHHIVHRDVKPENLLVEMEGSRVTCLKLGDFGLAQVVREPLYTVCGTPTYVAPEILAETGYGLKIDVWAAGVILYILLCGFPPFVSPENEQEELFERILSGQYEFTAPYWDTVSEAAKQLVSNMLQAQPELRFSAEDVLDHPWLAQSFLGGEQTAAATAFQSTEQHRDQQCQPIRQATFDFNFRKGHGNGVAGREQDKILNSLENDVFDEVDFTNGNRYRLDEPRSLSTECLGDIRAMTKSMRDLMDNLNGVNDSCFYNPAMSRTSSILSSDSVPEEVNKNIAKANYRGSTSNIVVHRGSPDSRYKIHSASKRNGNSLTDVRTRSPATPSPIRQRQRCDSGANATNRVGTKTAKSTERLLSRYKRVNSSESSGTSAIGSPGNIVGKNTRKHYADAGRSRNKDFGSTDCFVGVDYDGRSSSENDIETSDSFVNIQFAKTARSPNSSSTQSVESTDSFENVRFARDLQDRYSEKVPDVNDNDHDSTVPSIQFPAPIKRGNEPRTAVHANNRRTVWGANQIQYSSKLNGSKSLKHTENLVHHENVTGREGNSSKNSQKQSVTNRRDRRYTSHISASNSTDGLSEIRNETVKNKRFSTVGVRRPVHQFFDPADISGRLNRTVGSADAVEKDRKFSSTGELREENQKHASKPKRYSLYYTPQPSRKNYDPENRSGKQHANKVVDKTALRSNVKPTNHSKRFNEPTASGVKKEAVGNRKSVLETSTVASRNRSNKRNVHIRPETATTKIAPTRTK